MLGKNPLTGGRLSGLSLRVMARKIYLSILCLFFFTHFAAFAGQITVTLQDSNGGAFLLEQKVVVYELDADNNKHWRAANYSDQNGQVTFELEGLGSGGRYLLASSAYNNFKVYSQVLTEPGELLMTFGSTQITVLNGTLADKPPLLDTKVHVYRLDGEDKSWFTSVYTDSQGMLKIDLPGIDSGQPYILGSDSPISGQRKYSNQLTQSGGHQFVVGNLPLNVSLVDAMTGAAFVAQRVDAYYYDSEGKKRWYTRGETDSQGVVRFDLEGLGNGTHYVLRTKLFNDLSNYSDTLTSKGDYTFRIGTNTVNVLNGTQAPNSALAGHKVDFHKLLPDGSKEYFARVYSDENGQIRLNLPGVNQGQTYLVKAKSPLDDTTYYQQAISKEGVSDLVVGTLPLNVKLQDALTGNVLANKEISAYELFADGSKTRVAKRVTDDLGMVSFDLPQINDGKRFILGVKGFGDFRSYSDVISASGDYLFSVGKLRVSLKDGSQPGTPAMGHAELAIYKVVDGENKWFDSTVADGNGLVRLDLPGLSDGVVYRLRGRSSVNQSKKYSSPVSQNGDFEFVVGNPAVSVKVFNLLNNTVYPDEEVTAYWFDEAGKKQWYQRLSTDAGGTVLFDLDEINKGREYIFKVSKFDTGSSYSQTITASGHVDLGIGAVPLTLVDKESLSALSGIKVVAYKIEDNGDLSWQKYGYTNSAGQLTFDLSELQQGQRYTFKAKNPYGESKSYYGPVITGIGEVTFAIKQGEYGGLDLDAPIITIDTPDQDSANSAGFTLAGSVSDNMSVDRVDVSVGANIVAANVDSAANRWQAEVPAAWVSGLEVVTIEARAFDNAGNNAVTTRSFNLVNDTAEPVISILSHQNLQPVNTVGFTVLGTVSDDVGVQSIHATLVDPLLGETISNQSLNISSLTGQWALPVTNGKVSSDQTIQISLTATDVNGKTAVTDLLLNTESVSTNPIQLAQRITFGLTPALLNRIHSGDDYLAEQLAPESIDDSEFEAQMAARVITERADLRDYLVSYMVGSKKQLREVMAWFWENHFSTSINTHGSVSYELTENNLFRQHALGSFRDLLSASAKSAAMIEYLNNAQNVAGRANENYAREIMELHTMGVDGGYTADDIAELSRIFTGWHHSNGVFAFNDALHDNGDKIFLGQTIVGSGAGEGEQVLDILSAHPSTASFICSKLVTLFVSDMPVSSLQSQCSAEFLATSGDITAVLRVIFGSQAFAASEHYRSKLKTPLELMTATLRGFDAQLSSSDISNSLRRMGMSLFEFPAPTGFSEVAEDWLNSNALLQRLRLANLAASQTDMRGMMTIQGLTSAEAIVSYLFELTMANEYTELEYQLALSVLNDGGDFDFNGADAERKMTRLLGTLLSFPGYQYQ